MPGWSCLMTRESLRIRPANQKMVVPTHFNFYAVVICDVGSLIIIPICILCAGLFCSVFCVCWGVV